MIVKHRLWLMLITGLIFSFAAVSYSHLNTAQDTERSGEVILLDSSEIKMHEQIEVEKPDRNQADMEDVDDPEHLTIDEKLKKEPVYSPVNAAVEDSFHFTGSEEKVFNGLDEVMGISSVESPKYIQGILLVNKGYGLPEDYGSGEDQEARAHYEEMKAEARSLGYRIHAYSTYRSFNNQIRLYDRYVRKDGTKRAERYVARPGFSEHQTGLAFDIGWRGMTTSPKMGESEEGVWIHNNCHRFGFIVRYPDGKEHLTGYQYEPWHFRYIGPEMATKVYESGLSLDEFLGAIHPIYND